MMKLMMTLRTEKNCVVLENPDTKSFMTRETIPVFVASKQIIFLYSLVIHDKNDFISRTLILH